MKKMKNEKSKNDKKKQKHDETYNNDWSDDFVRAELFEDVIDCLPQTRNS